MTTTTTTARLSLPPVRRLWFVFLVLVASAQAASEQAEESCRANPTTTTDERDLLEEEQQPQSQPSQPRFPCTPEFLQDYWHDEPVPGFHIACFEEAEASVIDDSKEALSVTIFKFGLAQDPWHCRTTTKDWNDIKTNCLETTESQLGLSSPSSSTANLNFQPYALFTPEGQRLVTGGDDDDDDNDESTTMGRIVANVLLRTGVVLIFQGGQFLWPGVRVGFERRNVRLLEMGGPDDPTNSNHDNDNDTTNNTTTVTITTLSLKPLVVSIQGFLSDDECTYIQEMAQPSLQYSGVVLMDHDQGRPASDFRTSQSTFLTHHQDDLLRRLEDRVASLTRVPRSHQEHVQVLRYGLGEKYDYHTDYFDVSLYSQDRSTLALTKHGRRNRLATVFWYLSNVTAGGETAFPTTFGADWYQRTSEDSVCNFPDGSSSSSSSSGLLVKPERGKVIIFYSLLMSGKVDPNSLHEACPVKEGTKWAANKWIWNEPMHFIDE
ncbi:hypothetical protein ACA910_007637 [Epithemia clementina (nom. ined.)]